MTYDEIKNLLVENFCKGGTYDNSGRWRYSSEGNTVYLADKKGGWAYVCKKNEDITQQLMTIICARAKKQFRL